MLFIKVVHRISYLTKQSQLINFVFNIALKVVLPNSKICVGEKLVLSNSIFSMLTKLFRSVQRSLLYKGQWRKK